jgi:hypothetical protein
VVHIFSKTKNLNVQNYINDKFIKRICEQDLEFHFDGKGSHYLIAKDIIKDKSEIAYSDKILKEKYNHMR